MARQLNGFIEGTIDELLFYKMEGEYFVRMKSSLTGKRFARDKCFEGSRRSCSRFGLGNRVASFVFNLVTQEKRTTQLFPFLRRKAIELLKQDKTVEETTSALIDCLADFGLIRIDPVPLAVERRIGPATKVSLKDHRIIFSVDQLIKKKNSQRCTFLPLDIRSFTAILHNK